MKKKVITTFFSIIIAGGLLVFLISYGRPAASSANSFLITIRTSVYAKLSFFGSMVSEIKRTKALIEENLRLKEENRGLLSRLADNSMIKDENKSLRKALGLNIPPDRKLTDASIFNLQFTPEGYFISLNKGEKDGIKTDDVVISDSGILIGTVEETFTDHSRITTIMNGGFKATIKILEKDISGIAKGAMDKGVSLDFISQTDSISEGDIIITSGNDIFPAGLIIGKVILITSESGSLFKDVRVEPMLDNTGSGRVLVISK